MDDQLVGTMLLDLATLSSEAEKLSAEWDGKDSGKLEDIAHCASEISEIAQKLTELLGEIQSY